MHNRSVHEVQRETDFAQVLRDVTRQYPAPARSIRIAPCEQKEEDGGADVRVEFVFADHPFGDDAVEKDVARCVITRSVDWVGE